MTKQKKFITCDGNQAAAHISYMYRKCNPKAVLPAPFTVLCKPVR